MLMENNSIESLCECARSVHDTRVVNNTVLSLANVITRYNVLARVSNCMFIACRSPVTVTA